MHACVPACMHMYCACVLMLVCVCTAVCVHVCACMPVALLAHTLVALQHTRLPVGPGELTGGPPPPHPQRVSRPGGGACCARPTHLRPWDPVLVPLPFPLEVPSDLGILAVRLGLSPRDQEQPSQARPEEASELDRTWPAQWGPTCPTESWPHPGVVKADLLNPYIWLPAIDEQLNKTQLG